MGECRVKSRTVSPQQTGLDGRLQVRRQRRGAFDVSRMLRKIESYQSQEVREDSRTIPATGSDDTLHDLAGSILIQETFHVAKAEELLGLAFGMFVAFHLSAATCSAASSASRR